MRALFTLALALLALLPLTASAAAPVITNIAHFPSVSVHYTNYLAEGIVTNGLTLGGVRNTSWPAGGIPMSVSNNVASAGLLAVDSTKTNGIAATLAHITNAMALDGSTSKVILGNGTEGTVSALQTNVAAANPTATVATTAVNGTAATFMRSDAAPAIPAAFIQGNQTNVAAANPSASLGLNAVNGTATTFMRSDGAPSLSQSITPTWTGLHGFSAAANATELTIGGFGVNRGTLTHAGGNVLIDFAQTNRYWSCSITGNVTFVLTNASAGKHANLILTMPSTNCTPTFNLPANTITNFFGGAPSTLTGGTIGSLSYYCIDSTTNSTKVAYTETQ